MTHRLFTSVIFIGMLLLSVSLAVTQQDDFMKKATKSIEETGSKHTARTREEKKLSGMLFELLQDKEHPDTTSLPNERKSAVSFVTKSVKTKSMDPGGRIDVMITLRSTSDTISVAPLIRSLGGKIYFQGSVPAIGCKIRLEKLRRLISEDAIVRIRIPDEIKKNVTSDGDGQLKAKQARIATPSR
jgi:hypothetical protein